MESRLTLLTDEIRSMNFKMGSIEQHELAAKRKLAEKSKEFDDLTARFEAIHTSQGETESLIRDEIAMIQQENLKLHVQVEHSHAE